MYGTDTMTVRGRINVYNEPLLFLTFNGKNRKRWITIGKGSLRVAARRLPAAGWKTDSLYKFIYNFGIQFH